MPPAMLEYRGIESAQRFLAAATFRPGHTYRVVPTGANGQPAVGLYQRRAARWDGAVPLFETARHGHVPDVTEVRDLVDYVREHRTAGVERPFEFVLGGATSTDTARAKDVIGPLHDAGATWWDERQVQTGPDLDRLSPVLRRIEAGPPMV